MSSPDRKVAREALAMLLRGGVPAAQAVYSYQKAKFDGESPVIAVTSAGSERERFTMQGSMATFFFDINVFVLHADAESGWTEQDGEDTLDLLEKQIAAVIDQHTSTQVWSNLNYTDRSDIQPLQMPEGHNYLYEVISVSLQMV